LRIPEFVYDSLPEGGTSYRRSHLSTATAISSSLSKPGKRTSENARRVVANTSRKDGASAKKSKMIRNTRITKMLSTTLEARGKGLQLCDIGADDDEKP